MNDYPALPPAATPDHFQIVAENAPAMLWVGDAAGKCVYLNRALREFWGVSEERVQFFEWNSSLHPDDVSLLSGPFAEAMTTQTSLEVEARYRRADGAWRILHTRAEPRFDASHVFQGMVGINSDVTEQRALERTLRIQALLLEHMTEGVSLADEDGIIVFTNRAEDELFGYDPGELIGQHVSVQNAYDTQENEEIVSSVIRTLQQSGKWSGEWRNRRKDGTEFISAANITGVSVDGRLHFLCVQRDVTASRLASDRERLLMREIDHRAKNALAVVQSIVRLTPFADRDAYTRTITGRINSMARVHTLLAQNAWSGATIEQILKSELAPFETEGRFRIHGPPLHLRLEAAQPLTLLVHELATNATKYGSLSVPAGHLDVTWHVAPSGHVQLEWVESGGPAALKPERMGFGTKLIRGCAGQLGGEVHKTWGVDGLRCIVTIGTLQLQDGAMSPPPPKTGGVMGTRLEGSRILLVEDEILLAMEVAEHLQAAGATTVGPAQTLNRALSLIAAGNFDAVVLDMNLGGVSAEPILGLLRTAAIPVVVVTGYDGADLDCPVLFKPVDSAALVDAVGRLLEASDR